MNRTERLRSLVNTGGFGLEIGPSHNPIFPKSEGFHVEILDHMPAGQLREKYKALGVDNSRIEEVDHISTGKKLHDVIPRRHEYDYIFSSHAIEHVTDFVGYFESCELLLKPNGVIALAVPNKRYTFDAFQPISTTGRVLEAYYRQQKRHSPAAVFDFIANFATMNGQEVWSKHDTGDLHFPHALSGARDLLIDSIATEGAYHDIHGWIFTPNSFRLIMQDLKNLGLVSVEEFFMHEEDALEFHVGLSSAGAGHGFNRKDLQMKILEEITIGHSQLLGLQ